MSSHTHTAVLAPAPGHLFGADFGLVTQAPRFLEDAA